MTKTEQKCPFCESPLKFREWSGRYDKKSRWQEALALCPNGCGKLGVRYFDGVPTCDPYQVRSAAKKTKSCSARTEPDRYFEIVALWGSFQSFVDNVNILPCNTQQYKQ